MKVVLLYENAPRVGSRCAPESKASKPAKWIHIGLSRSVAIGERFWVQSQAHRPYIDGNSLADDINAG